MGVGEHDRDLVRYRDYMAPEAPWPPSGTLDWARRVVMEGELPGKLFLLFYCQSVRETVEGFDTVPGQPELTRLLAHAQAATAGWERQAADELRHLRPSDAPNAVEAILAETNRWRQASNYTATLSHIRPAMEALLAALVAPEHHADVQQVFEIVAVDPDLPLARVEPCILGCSDPYPFQAVHLAGAYAGALLQQPECVPDQEGTIRELAVETHKLATGDFSVSPAGSTALPTSPSVPRAVAPKRKAARKAQRQARRRRR